MQLRFFWHRKYFRWNVMSPAFTYLYLCYYVYDYSHVYDSSVLLFFYKHHILLSLLLVSSYKLSISFFSCLGAYGCLVQKMSMGNYWYLNVSPIQFSLFFKETIEKWTKILLLKTRNLEDQLNFNFSWIMFSLFSRSMSPYI